MRAKNLKDSFNKKVFRIHALENIERLEKARKYQHTTYCSKKLLHFIGSLFVTDL